MCHNILNVFELDPSKYINCFKIKINLTKMMLILKDFSFFMIFSFNYTSLDFSIGWLRKQGCTLSLKTSQFRLKSIMCTTFMVLMKISKTYFSKYGKDNHIEETSLLLCHVHVRRLSCIIHIY